MAALPLQSVEGLRIFGTHLIATVANVGSSGHDGIHIYSLANPASPSFLGSATIGEASELIDVTVLGDYAFTTSYNSKIIEVFDISNKSSPSSTTNMSRELIFRFTSIMMVNASCIRFDLVALI